MGCSHAHSLPFASPALRMAGQSFRLTPSCRTSSRCPVAVLPVAAGLLGITRQRSHDNSVSTRGGIRMLTQCGLNASAAVTHRATKQAGCTRS